MRKDISREIERKCKKQERGIRTGMKPSNWVAATIFPRRNWSFPMGLLQVLHDDRADLAYSAFHGFGGLAIVESSRHHRSQTDRLIASLDSWEREGRGFVSETPNRGVRNLFISFFLYISQVRITRQRAGSETNNDSQGRVRHRSQIFWNR